MVKTYGKRKLKDDPGILVWLLDIVLPFSYSADNNSNDNSKENELGKLIVDLWKCGWFLSDWATSLYSKSGKMSRTHFHMHPDLYLSGDSMIDGLRSLEILRMINLTICHYET